MNGIDAKVDALFRPVADLLSAVVFFKVPLLGAELPLVVLWLVAGAVFFTFRFRFVNITGMAHAIRLVSRREDGDPPGEVTHFQALATAVSGTVGIGNIGGVAVAITMGGPGAAFWLVVAGFLGMSTKFVECTLGVLYREESPIGAVSGGPMYYLDKGLAEAGWPRLGRALGVFYAGGIVVGCLGIGNMFQSNQAFVQIVAVTGGESSWLADKGWLVGLVIAGVVASVIVGGIRSIARVTGKLVPAMAVFYLVGCAAVLVANLEALPWAIRHMWEGAFTMRGIGGGAVGAMIVGFQRAVFSNEAGIGSATIAHAAVLTREPMTEGYVALLEPFIDTVVICNATALVIITTSYFEPGFATNLGGIEMTSAAFARVASWAPMALAVAATLFALSTAISWSYYGLKGWTYLVGESRRSELLFKFFFCGFLALGASVQLSAVLDFSDALVFLICIPNILGLYVLTPTVLRELEKYRERRAALK